MNNLAEALNHPSEAMKRDNRWISWSFVIITVLINSLLDPLFQYLFSEGETTFNILWSLKITGFGILSYLVVCICLWAVCRVLGSRATAMKYIDTWGLSFAPNIVCAVVVSLTEIFFYVFWNSTIWGMLLSIVFVGILLWKVIIYFIFLREVAGLKGIRLFGAAGVIAVIILAMAALNGWLGVKTPIL